MVDLHQLQHMIETLSPERLLLLEALIGLAEFSAEHKAHNDQLFALGQSVKATIEINMLGSGLHPGFSQTF